MTALLLVHWEVRRSLSLRYTLFLFSLWLVALSYFFHQLELLTGRKELFLAAAATHSLGSLAYIVVAPPFYHAALGKPLTKAHRWGYATMDLLVLFLALGLAWERYRGPAVVLLHTLLFALVLYGTVLIALSYRTLAEEPLRRAAGAFALLSLLFFPPLYIESRPELLAPFIYSHWFDGVAIPLFVLSVSALSIPFVLSHVYRPAYADKSGPTDYFLEKYSLSPREGELLAFLSKGMSNREIAAELSESEKSVEGQLAGISQRTGVSGRPQLANLLLANR